MALVITAGPSDELLSVEDAKRHLRVMNGDLDDEITSLVRAARDYCERCTQRTFRKTVTRTLTLNWWWGGIVGQSPYVTYQDLCKPLALPWPPLIAVSSVTYFDVSNVSQTLNSSNYVVVPSTDGGGRLVWAVNASPPGLYIRPDAVTVTFTTGYTSLDSTTAPLPPVALQAMKMMLTVLWGAGTDNETKAAERCVENLLGTVDWTGYA